MIDWGLLLTIVLALFVAWLVFRFALGVIGILISLVLIALLRVGGEK
jgi:hypothetical protein